MQLSSLWYFVAFSLHFSSGQLVQSNDVMTQHLLKAAEPRKVVIIGEYIFLLCLIILYWSIYNCSPI